MDKSYIKSIVQKILNKEFSISQKRKIDDYSDRLNFACCYCGDSTKSAHKKRGNIWFNKLIFVCFNCDKKVSFDKFVRDFDEILDPSKKLEIIEHLNSVVSYSDYESDLADTNLDNLFNLSEIEDLFNNKKVAPIYDFSPIVANSGIYKYLVGRGIHKDLHKDIYQAKFSKGEDSFEHVIVLLNRREDKILGMQVRNLKEGRKRFFLIYNWENIYRWLHGEDVEIDMNQSVLYNKLSYYFNVLNVDFGSTVTIFEGFLDSLFYPNSIGVVGVNTDLKLLENNNLDLQYFYDNDFAGFKKSEEKIRNGKPVFLWSKLFESIVSSKRSSDPYLLKNRISKVKDLNKLCELVPGAFGKLRLGDFFSKDILDLKFIPKATFKPKNTEKNYRQKFATNRI